MVTLSNRTLFKKDTQLMTVSHNSPSLFAPLLAEWGNRLSVSRFSAPGLARLMHVMEDTALHARLPGILLTASDTAAYCKRYAAANAHRTTPIERMYVPTERTGEWFAILLADGFTGLVAGRLVERTDRENGTERTREYDTVWTFEPGVVESALIFAGTLLAGDQQEKLHSFRRKFNHRTPDYSLVSHFTSEVLREHESMYRELRSIQSALTERENALDESERRFTQIVESITHHIYVMELSGSAHATQRHYTFLSANLEALTGFTLDELKNCGDIWLRKIVHPSDQPTAEAHLKRLLRGQPSVIECRIIRKDGGVVWVQDSARSQTHLETGATVIYGAVSDIGERKQFETAQRDQVLLQLELKKAHELSNVRSEFMSAVSHEFRTPLSMILSSCELLLHYGERYTQEERLARLRAVIHHIQHLTGLLDDISIILSSESGHMEFAPRRTNLYGLVENIIDGIRLTDGSKHTFTLTQTDDSGNLHLDPKLVRHIVTNLIGNAVKYSKNGTEIHCELEVLPTYVVIHVADEGIGIPQAELDAIFEAFRRASNAGDIEGTGLGLKIVKDSVTLHKGFINAQSAVGHGTVFSVTLPLLETSVI